LKIKRVQKQSKENRKRALNIHYIYAVLEVGDGVFEVLSTSGDTHLGGDDFDKVGPALLYFKFIMLLWI